jgi:hypothetical protein
MQVSDMNRYLGGSLTECTCAPASFLFFLVTTVIIWGRPKLGSQGGTFATAILYVARPHHLTRLDWCVHLDVDHLVLQGEQYI